jgi:hypothetical protein
MSFGEHHVGSVVIEGELVLRQFVEQRFPAVGERVPVTVVFRPDGR